MADKPINPFASWQEPASAALPPPALPNPTSNPFTGWQSGTDATLQGAPSPEVKSNYDLGAVPGQMLHNFLPNAGKVIGDAADAVGRGAEYLVKNPGAVGHALVHDVLPDLPGHLIDIGGKLVEGTLGKYFDFDKWKQDLHESGKPSNLLNYFDWDKTKTTAAERPAEFMLDLSTLAPALRLGSASKLGPVAGPESKVIEAMDPSKALTTLRRVAESATGGAKQVADHMVQAADGIGEGAVEQMLNAGKAANKDAWKVMTGGLDWDKSADTVKDSLGQLFQKRGANYITDMAQVAGAHTPINFTRVDAAVDDAMKVGRYKSPTDTTPGGGVRYGDRAGGTVDKTRDAIRNAVDEWKLHGPDYHTAIGFDKLKQTINAIGDDAKVGSMPTPASKMVSQVSRAIQQTIAQTPEASDYAKAMTNYQERSRQLENLISEFSLNSKNNLSTFRKLQKVWRQSADVAHGERTNLLRDALEETGNSKLMDDLAAAQFNPWFPRGLRGAAVGTMLAHGLFHNPLGAIGTAGAMSPRLAGTAAYGLGRLQTSPLGRLPAASYDIAERAAPAGVRAQQWSQQPQERRGGFFGGDR